MVESYLQNLGAGRTQRHMLSTRRDSFVSYYQILRKSDPITFRRTRVH